MKVLTDRSTRARSAWRASVVTLASALVAFVGLVPTPASAITRTTVLDRAHVWVKKKVRYSQSKYFHGYRRDCSGFVSMAWKLGRSYTSRTIHHVAHRVPLSKLKPGDAVHYPGHVAIFVAWKNKAHGLYVAMEESSWGKPALRRVRPLGHNATALRFKHITDPAAPAAPTAPAQPTDTTGSINTTGSADASSVATAAASFATSLSVPPTETLAVSLKENLVALVPFFYSPALLSSIQVSTLSEPS